jgi:hypothetical protein
MLSRATTAISRAWNRFQRRDHGDRTWLAVICLERKFPVWRACVHYQDYDDKDLRVLVEKSCAKEIMTLCGVEAR